MRAYDVFVTAASAVTSAAADDNGGGRETAAAATAAAAPPPASLPLSQAAVSAFAYLMRRVGAPVPAELASAASNGGA